MFVCVYPLACMTKRLIFIDVPTCSARTWSLGVAGNTRATKKNSARKNGISAENAHSRKLSSHLSPAVASTSGRIQAEYIRLLFLHAHRGTVQRILGMTGAAAQPNISDDCFKSKRAAFLNALKCKTGLILAKAAAMRI